MHSASNGGCSMTRKYAATAGVLLLLGVSFVSAQVSTSSITGAVTDSSGAMVVNAKIEAKNDDNGVVFEQHTTGAGTYTFSSLTPGSYSITVTMAGFRTFTSTHNILTVGTPLVVRSEEHTSEPSHGYISYAVFCLKKKKHRAKQS